MVYLMRDAMDEYKRKLVIFGCSDYARLVKKYFDRTDSWKVVAFTVDSDFRKIDSFFGLPVFDFENAIEKFPPEDCDFFVAVGYKDMNSLRMEKIAFLQERGYKLATYIDDTCAVFDKGLIGENCFVLENVVIQPDSHICDGTYIGSGVCIGHDVYIGKCCFIAIGTMITGFVEIGDKSFIGANSTINNHVKIAESTLVGASCYIAKNTRKYGVYLSKQAENVTKKIGYDKEFQKTFL